VRHIGYARILRWNVQKWSSQQPMGLNQLKLVTVWAKNHPKLAGVDGLVWERLSGEREKMRGHSSPFV
jgi:hypothetical protein